MSGTLAVCHITDEVRDRLKKFRFSKETTMQAIILKISREEQNMEVEEYLEDCSIDEVKDELPQQQPRFILLSYAMKHQDGRTSYPMCLIFFSPSGCSPEQQMLYAGSRNSLVNECQLTKNFEIRDIDEFTQEFVDAKVV